MQRDGDLFEIRIKDGDIKSHKKYWYAVSDFAGSPIVTIDDDIIYPSDMIEKLVMASIKYPKSIPAMFTSKVCRKEKKLLPYSQWRGNAVIGKPDKDTFFGSGGGAFFPVGSLNNANQPIENIMRVCPTADDIWLNAIVRSNGYSPMAICQSRGCPEWAIEKDQKLSDVNNGQKKNDEQLFAVAEYFAN